MTNPLEAIFCDDIRREDNGKLLIIGAYGGNIIVNKLPVQLRLSIWIRATDLPESPSPGLIKISVNAEQVHQIDISDRAQDDTGLTQFLLIGVPIDLEAPSRITVELKIDDDKTERRAEIEVTPAAGER
ncbi:DUF6941 family protein [Roseovarius aestuariivivens]|uniref:DUF6941 family protein n=1 Tax=Roseovarius aestuariivivens TaxID=1888910 RepID=UPI001080CA60|nr:hypothetical protein [Roseovarius aestuariivivens]